MYTSKSQNLFVNMKTSNLALEKLQYALQNAFGKEAAFHNFDDSLSMDALTALMPIIRNYETEQYITLPFYDAFVMRYNLDKSFANELDAAIDAVKTYKELATMVDILYLALCKEEHLLTPLNRNIRIHSLREKEQEIAEVKKLLHKTGTLKTSLKNILKDIDYFYQLPEIEDRHAPEVMRLISRGLDIKTELIGLVEESKARISLIKFKKKYGGSFAKIQHHNLY